MDILTTFFGTQYKYPDDQTAQNLDIPRGLLAAIVRCIRVQMAPASNVKVMDIIWLAKHIDRIVENNRYTSPIRDAIAEVSVG